MDIMSNQTDVKGTEATNLSSDYVLLSELFLYPHDEAYRKKLTKVQDWLSLYMPEAALILQPFIQFVEAARIREIQELFLRSFDVQAITTLDIGFILFGEDYKRGKLLVHLNEEHRQAGNNCETELSDHLPNLLRLLPKMKDSTVRNEIATLLIIPAIEKMVAEFSGEKIEKKDVVYKKHQKVLLDYSPNHRTIYQNCLKAVLFILRRDFGSEQEAGEKNNSARGCADPNIPGSCEADSGLKDFSQNIETEMLTEK